MLLNDKQIKEMQELHGVLTPFVDHKVKEGLSYGLGCHGYDIRIDKEFLIPKKPKKGVFLDPKNSQSFGWNKFETEERFILYPKTFVLAKSVEYIKMPQDVMAIALTKSTYARVGVFANITPLDAMWRGILTIEIANLGAHPVYIYPMEGIAQLLFFKIDKPEKGYDGKYQGQSGITLAK